MLQVKIILIHVNQWYLKLQLVVMFLTNQGKAVLVTGTFVLFKGLISYKEHDSEKMQGECMQPQEAIHHSAYVFLLIHQRTATVLIPREKFRAEGSKQTTFIIVLQLSISLFYIPACRDNINSINIATPLAALDWNNDNIQWLLQKDTRLHKSRELKLIGCFSNTSSNPFWFHWYISN